ncbi:phosphoribosylanthranilate isomerase [Albibacterium bauzanense]|uniref:N-(5'-phosphoribosyl)anthranilate isomerase n=1 Tax=Albibacterium bauzanense TaxID=653929 RepID=A0A4R1M528_9SPHI|nr:phosphoribosylanthranilate isomerase [Albibacterium bauzanense]TCK84843.1 phosphoribosylanthranilate isomerase [Albibacterium bauzanense]
MRPLPVIKICGLREPSNIKEVLSLDPQYIGFVFYPSSSRFVGELDIEYIKGLKDVKKTAVFVNASLEEIVTVVNKYQFDAIQLHGHESVAFCKDVKESTGLEIIKAFGIDSEFDFNQLEPYLLVADYFLFDTKTSIYGGSGRVFNWDVLKRYPFDKRYFLSGGIDLDNFQDAYTFEDERLYAIDLNSRFESSPGIKNILLLKQALKK